MADNNTKLSGAIVGGVAVVLIAFLAVGVLLNAKGCTVKASAETTATTTAADPTATPKPTEPPVKQKTEEEVSSYTDEKLLEIFGQPRPFKRTSTKIDEGARVKATGFKDAVTYDANPKDDLEGVINEILTNPIYLSNADLALREVNVVGQSDWAKKFHASFDPVTTEWWQQWIEKKDDGNWYVTKEYHLIACRYACIIRGLQFVKEVESSKIKVHFPLNVEMEVSYRSTSQEKYPFWVYKFQFKDGRVIYVGINKLDYRWAILPPGPTPTPTKKVTPTPTESKKVTPTPTTKPKSKKNDPINRNKDKNAAADIGTPDAAENHDNNTTKTSEPTSPKKQSAATPTPKPTTTSIPKATPTTKPAKSNDSVNQKSPTPKIENGLKGDKVVTGTAPNKDPDG